MSFEFNEVIAQMLAAVKGTVADDWPELKATAHDFFERKKDRLELLAQLRLEGELTDAQWKLRLKHEKLSTEAEFHALAVISKAAAQRAAQAAFGVLEKAVKAALGALL